MLLKSTSLFSLSILLCSMSYMTAYADKNVFRNGFYTGIEGGYIASNITLNDKNNEINRSFKGEGGLIGLYGGYGFLYKNFYITPEIGIAHSLFSSSSKIWRVADGIPGVSLSLRAKSSQKWFIEPRIKIGYMIKNMMPYMHIGVSLANEKFTTTMIVADTVNNVTQINYTNKYNFWRTGFKYGGGMEIPITTNITFRFEGTHILYNHKNVTARNEYPIYDLFVSRQNLKIKSRLKNYFRFTSGITYHF